MSSTTSTTTAAATMTEATAESAVEVSSNTSSSAEGSSSSSSSSSNGGFDMQLFKEIISNILLFMLLFGMSATVDFQALVHQLKNKRAIISGVIMQYVFMPVLGFASVMMLGPERLHPAVGITLLVVTSSPGGSYSNLICNLANADLPLSVAMTALSTILSVVMLPANLLLYSKLAYGNKSSQTSQTDAPIDEDATVLLHSIDWGALFITLGIVLSAILSGLFTSSKLHSKKFRRWCNRIGTICGVLLIVVSVAVSSGNVETRLWNKDWAFYVGVSFPALIGLFLANVIALCVVRLKKPEVVTVAVECCYQNVGIATSVALSMFDDPTLQGNALCVPMYYGLLEAVVLTIYAIIAWKLGWTKAPPDENICVAMGTTYEVSDDDTSSASMQETLTMSESTLRNGNRSMDDDDDDDENNGDGNGLDVETGRAAASSSSTSPNRNKKNIELAQDHHKKKKHKKKSKHSKDNSVDDDDWNYDNDDEHVKKNKATIATASTPSSTSCRDRLATASMTEEEVDAYFGGSTPRSVRRIPSSNEFPTTPRSAVSFDGSSSSVTSLEYDTGAATPNNTNSNNNNYNSSSILSSPTWPAMTATATTGNNSTSPQRHAPPQSQQQSPSSHSNNGTTGTNNSNRSRLYSREPLMLPPLHE